MTIYKFPAIFVLAALSFSVQSRIALANDCAAGDTCSPKHLWVEALNLGGGGGSGVSFISTGLTLNLPIREKTIAIDYRVMNQNYLSSRAGRDKRDIDGKLKSAGVSYVWHWPARSRYMSASVGLAHVSGEVGENCEKAPSIIFQNYVCDAKDVSTVGIPVRFTVAAGRRVGIAAQLEVNINSGVPYVMSSVSIPLGRFAL